MSVPPTVALKHRLQRMLPADITIHDVTVAPSGFDARFSALERTYVYRVADRASEVDPRLRGFVLHLDADLDVAAMNEAAAMTIGLHDFGSFATPNPGGTTIREVKTAYWRRIPTRPLVVDGMGERYRTPAGRIRPAVLHHRRRRLRSQHGALAGRRLHTGRHGQALDRLVPREDGRAAARGLHRADRAARADAGARRLSRPTTSSPNGRAYTRQAHAVDAGVGAKADVRQAGRTVRGATDS